MAVVCSGSTLVFVSCDILLSVGLLHHQGFRFAWQNSTIPTAKRLFGDEGLVLSLKL